MSHRPRLSFRLKLLLASVAVQLAVMALLVGTVLSQLRGELRQQGELRIAQFAALADTLLAAPLLQRDPTGLQQTLDRMRRADTISYLVLLDPQGQVLAASGWNLGRALPPVDVGLRALDFDRADTTLHAQTDIGLAGQQLGSLRYGFPTEFMHAAQNDLLWRTLPLAASLLLLTAALLAGLGRWLTRQLSRLETASARISAGDYAARAEILDDDDIGRLAQGFNAMAAATQLRLNELQASEALQRRHRAEAQDEHARLQALVEAMDSGILFVDAEERVFYVNGAFLRIWRLPPASVPPGRPLSDVGAMLRTQMDDAGGRRHVLCPLPAGQASDRVELTTLDDRQVLQRQQRVSGAPGGMVGRLVIHDDVSAERRVQRRAARADRDMLTDLLNRRGLQDALTAAVAEGGVRGTPLVLFFIDLDDFKYTNDTFGHRVGDQLLRDVAGALAAELRPGEAVARIGGDEFAVLCPGLDAAAGARLAPRLVQAVARLPVDARGHELRVGCSVGLAVFPDDAPSADSLMVCADLAMYDAKRLGKHGWAAYRHDAERTLSESAHLRWSARLTRAIDEQRFCLQFQAVHHAASPGGVAHYEALLRLPSEDAGGALVAPGEFVPYAERSGRIRPIDRWVMGECVRALAAAPVGVRVAANLSARSIDDRSLPDHLQALLAQHAVDPRRLLIEITETSTIGDPRAAGEMIGRLRALGCSVHLDDFGAGFASFAHLKLLPVDGIKIDGSYVRGLARHDDNRALVAAMVAVARALGMTTVAEHVEDEDTLVTLRMMGVDLVQGFLLDRPRTLDLATLDA
jgi:diguanylate cyclase (GGDEF)-like protein